MRAIALIGLILLGAIASAWVLLPEAFPELAPRTVLATTAAPPRPAAAPAAAASQPRPAVEASTAVPGPRFDVARVGARGALVTAGRATPGVEVVLLDGNQELGRARADARGEWVILPGEALAPGAHELSLAARPAGGDPLPGQDTVVLLVPGQPLAQPSPSSSPSGSPPEPGTGGTPPTTMAVSAGRGLPATGQPGTGGAMAMLLPPANAEAAPRLLQGPAPGQARLSVDVVDYDEAGAMRFAGSAAPGTAVRLYAGNRHLGDAQADQAGRWVVTPGTQPGLGRHLLRADQITAAGAVVARVEVPFQRDELPQELLRDGKVVVQPGHSLWRLARLAYGSGVRYTVIYEANRDQIRDASLIYPGQVFALPEEQRP